MLSLSFFIFHLGKENNIYGLYIYESCVSPCLSIENIN
jgi:hypothetical protein